VLLFKLTIAGVNTITVYYFSRSTGPESRPLCEEAHLPITVTDLKQNHHQGEVENVEKYINSNFT
jgi:hypothetical protein